MEKKLTIIEIIIVVIAAIIYLFISVLPNFKKTIGTSDHFIKTSSYLNMYEINIDNKVNFAFIEDNEEKIYHILFFDENSTCLYNQNIEKKYVNAATTETIKILIENNYLNSKSVLSITRYNETGYINFKNIFIKNLKEYNINTISNSHIIPILIGDNEKTIEVSEKLKSLGYYIPAIRPPTVPSGTSRLRISLTSDCNIEDFQRLVESLKGF